MDQISQRPPMGRPKKPDKIDRPETLYVRLSRWEKLEILKGAKGSSVVEWCRRTLLGAAGRHKAQSDEIGRLSAAVEFYKNAFQQSRSQGGECPKPDMVPARIRLPIRIAGDWPIGHDTQVGPGDFDCECNQYGAISVKAENGELLGVMLYECDILEWKPNDKL